MNDAIEIDTFYPVKQTYVFAQVDLKDFSDQTEIEFCKAEAIEKLLSSPELIDLIDVKIIRSKLKDFIVRASLKINKREELPIESPTN